MNEMQIFDNPAFGSVRTLEQDDGVILFCAADIASALGYAKPRNAIQAHCKGALKRGILTNGGKQEMTFIQEPDVYRLITHSKLPEAEKFEKWVFEEVLPTIRKHGAYMTPDVLEKACGDLDFTIGLLSKLKEERAKAERLETALEAEKAVNRVNAPKALYYDTMSNCEGLLSATQIAKDYGESATWLNKWLHDHGVQYKQGGVWVLYQEYADKGYTGTKEHCIPGDGGTQHGRVHTYWTFKGKQFIHDLLRENGILPMTEKIKIEQPKLFEDGDGNA